MKFARHILTLVVLAITACAQAADVGIIPNNRLAAADNTLRWSRANAAGKIVTLPTGNIYISETITTRPTVGCMRLESLGAGGYDVGGHPTLTGFRSRVVMLGKGPCVRISGAGAVIDDPIEWVSDGETIFEIEGRAVPATGRHRIRNQVFVNAKKCIHCLAGYYEPNGDFTANENHADNSVVEGCEEFNCEIFFCSDNQQSVKWKFYDTVLNWTGGKSCTLADIRRGGHCTFDGVMVNDPRATLFKVRDFSPNNCRLTARDVCVDRMPDMEFWCRLVDYDGVVADAKHYHWPIDIELFAATTQTQWDSSKLYRVPADLPRDKWRISVEERK